MNSKAYNLPKYQRSLSEITSFVEALIGEDLHAKRIYSLSNGVLGVLNAATLGIHAIGNGLAAARGLKPKHAIKQVDRLLSNNKFQVWEVAQQWIEEILSSRKEVVIALDWTTFDQDKHQMLAAYLVTNHGRARPLFWKTFTQSEYESAYYECLESALKKLRELIPRQTRVTILADRGFGHVRFFEFLATLEFDFVIRIPSNIKVTDHDGEVKKAKDWTPPSCRPVLLKNPLITAQHYQGGAFVAVRDKGMNEPWCLVTSYTGVPASKIVKLYARRFTIEEVFRDLKDPRFGMGMLATKIANPLRRDRLILIQAIAVVFLTILGAAGEESGYSRYLKSNTSKTRTYSLLNQGLYYYAAIPNMPDKDLLPIIQIFNLNLQQHPLFKRIFEVV